MQATYSAQDPVGRAGPCVHSEGQVSSQPGAKTSTCWTKAGRSGAPTRNPGGSGVWSSEAERQAKATPRPQLVTPVKAFQGEGV